MNRNNLINHKKYYLINKIYNLFNNKNIIDNENTNIETDVNETNILNADVNENNDIYNMIHEDEDAYESLDKFEYSDELTDMNYKINFVYNLLKDELLPNNQPDLQLDNQINNQQDNYPDDQPNVQPDNQQDNQPNNQPNVQLNIQPNNQPNVQLNIQPKIIPNNQPNNKTKIILNNKTKIIPNNKTKILPNNQLNNRKKSNNKNLYKLSLIQKLNENKKLNKDNLIEEKDNLKKEDDNLKVILKLKEDNLKVIPKLKKDNLIAVPKLKEDDDLKEDADLKEEDNLSSKLIDHQIELLNLYKEIYQNNIENNIYIIGGLEFGGYIKYINDIKQNFKNVKEIHYLSFLQEINFTKYDILLVQHLYKDITFSTLLDIKNKFNCRIIISIHDFYLLNDNLDLNENIKLNNFNNINNSYLNDNIIISKEKLDLFNIAELIIHPSKFTYDIFSKYFSNHNFIISPPIDILIIESKLNIPIINDNIINIGVFHEFNDCKGRELISYLSNMIKYVNGYVIKFIITGINIPKYSDNEFFEYINKYNIHGLTLLNKWGETYCYSLTKFLKSGLPIIYNNIGSFQERIPKKNHYFKVFNNENEININDKILEIKFYEMIDFIILNQGITSIVDVKNDNEIPYLYKNLFNNVFKNQQTNNVYDVQAYCIYLPQFHSFEENDICFYKDYTDIHNLNLFINNTKINQVTPSNKLLEIENIFDYNLLKNEKIIQKQIELIAEHNIKGFAIYYYWFSKNTINYNDMIMENVINKFFSDDINMMNRKVFFIWANESWNKNTAYSNLNDNIIENKYNLTEFIKNIDNLITYFKHSNYLKIDNKPVFFIHQPWNIENDKLELFNKVINKKCIENDFDGCNLVLNSINRTYKNFKNYDFNLNLNQSKYKTLINNQTKIDYNLFLNDNDNNNIKTLLFNFDNRSKYYKPNKLKYSWNIINNNFYSHIEIINKTYETYRESKNNIDRIMLINSWNEWGEQSSIEPSNEMGTYYLDLFKNIFVLNKINYEYNFYNTPDGPIIGEESVFINKLIEISLTFNRLSYIISSNDDNLNNNNINDTIIMIVISLINPEHALSEFLSFLEYYKKNKYEKYNVGISQFIVDRIPYFLELIELFIKKEKIIIIQSNTLYNCNKIIMRRNHHFIHTNRSDTYKCHTNNLQLQFDNNSNINNFFSLNCNQLLFKIKEIYTKYKDNYTLYDTIMFIKTDQETHELELQHSIKYPHENIIKILLQNNIKIINSKSFKDINEYICVLYHAKKVILSYGKYTSFNKYFCNPDAEVIVLANLHYKSQYNCTQQKYWHIKFAMLAPVRIQHFLLDFENELTIENINRFINIQSIYKYSLSDKLSSHIYIIGGVSSGGSFKYINEIMVSFPDVITQITRNDILQKYEFHKNDILFIQHLHEDITFDIIVELKKKYDCRVIITVHDYYYLRSIRNPENGYLYNDLIIEENVKNLFKCAELIIHPSQFTFNNYSKKFTNNNFIMCPHIDYEKLDSDLYIPKIIDNVINIGVLHPFSNYKGKELITHLMNKISTYKNYNIKFKIVDVNIPYYNEDEFFSFLPKYNIHCLTLLNKWGETYCYSLSKFLKAGLPIIYNAIGAVGERMPNKEYHFKVYENEQDIDKNNEFLENNIIIRDDKLEQIFFKMLDYIIDHQSDSERDNNINLNLKVPDFYNNLFSINKYKKIDNLSVKNIILLSSSIVTSDKPLSYTDIRSGFCSKERLQQTIKNINIIRYKIPDSAIILIDATKLPEDYKEILNDIVDQYIDISNDEEQYKFANESPLKGVAECKQLLKGLDYITEYENAINIFKISGRYFLSKSFKYENFNLDKVYFKTIPKSCIFYEPVPACYTFLFKVPFKYKNKFKLALQKSIVKGLENKKSVETILPYEFDSEIVIYDAILGVSGYVGPSKVYLDDIV